MRALVVSNLGNPLNPDTGKQPLQVQIDYPAPSLSSEQVRIEVTAAGINFADTLLVQGLYQVKPKLPFIPGSEVSGVITEVGSAVRGLNPGDKVCTVVDNGGFAEQLAVNQAAVIKLPDNVDMAAAAGLPVAFGTAYMALVERAKVEKGQTVLVLGAGGGVGTAAVQIAHVSGARVIAVARGAEKCQAIKGLGADHVIDSGSLGDKPLRSSIKAAAPKGVDVVVDLVGGQHFEDSLKCVRWGAHVLIIGFASGHIPKVAANIALVKNLTLHGIYWGSYLQHNPKILGRSIQQPLQWLAQGKIHVPVSHRYPLEQAVEGFKALMLRKAVGKVLLLPNSQSSKL